MSDRFDELIHVSMPDMPDAAEYRRLNRVPLRTPVKRFPGLPKPGPSFVAATTCLVLMVVFSGQVSQLGSYDGTLEYNETTGLTGTAPGYYSQELGSTEFVVPSLMEKEDVDEFHQAIVAAEYVVTGLTRTSIGSKSIWSLEGVVDVNGRQVVTGLNSGDHPKDESQFDEDFATLYRDHMADLMNRVRNTPPTRTETVESDGYQFLMKVWSHSYPGLGVVEYAEGPPIRPLD